MKIDTRDFGTIEIDPQQVIQFKAGIFGFDGLREFVLLSDDSVDGPFTWLQAVADREVCFILVDPQMFWADYCPMLPEDTKRLLELTSEQQPVYRVIAVIPQDFAQATVNLKSPIVINPTAKCAVQVILDTDYLVRARLLQTEDAPC